MSQNLFFKRFLVISASVFFGVLIDVFTSIRITNLSIKEESEYPILVDPLQAVEYQKRETKKAELLAKN